MKDAWRSPFVGVKLWILQRPLQQTERSLLEWEKKRNAHLPKMPADSSKVSKVGTVGSVAEQWSILGASRYSLR